MRIWTFAIIVTLKMRLLEIESIFFHQEPVFDHTYIHFGDSLCIYHALGYHICILSTPSALVVCLIIFVSLWRLCHACLCCFQRLMSITKNIFALTPLATMCAFSARVFMVLDLQQGVE